MIDLSVLQRVREIYSSLPYEYLDPLKSLFPSFSPDWNFSNFIKLETGSPWPKREEIFQWLGGHKKIEINIPAAIKALEDTMTSSPVTIALFGASLLGTGALSLAALSLLVGGTAVCGTAKLALEWSGLSSSGRLQQSAILAGGIVSCFVGGMAGQAARTGIKGLLAFAAKGTSIQGVKKMITNRFVTAATTRFGEAYAFNGIQAGTNFISGDKQALEDMKIWKLHGLVKTVRTAVWFDSSQRVTQWRQTRIQGDTLLHKGRVWFEGALAGSTLDWGLKGVTPATGLEIGEHATAGLWDHLSQDLPQLALMHAGNKVVSRVTPPKASMKLGELEKSYDISLTKSHHEAMLDETYTRQLRNIEKILNGGKKDKGKIIQAREVAVSDFSGVASVMWATLRRQAQRESNDSIPIIFAFGSRGNATKMAEQMARGIHPELKDIDVQRGQKKIEAPYQGPRRRLYVIPANERPDLAQKAQAQATVTLCNASTAAIPNHYTVERVQRMPKDNKHYVVHMMKGEVVIAQNGKTEVYTPREYMTEINRQAGREDIPIVMWVGFDGAAPTIKGSPRVHDGGKIFEILVTCSHLSPEIAKNASVREAAANSGMRVKDGETRYMDFQGVHDTPAPGRVEVVVFENNKLPRPVKMTAVWHPEVVKAQELIASAKNKWTSVFGQKVYEWQMEQIEKGRKWSAEVENEQKAYEQKMIADLEKEMMESLIKYEAIPAEFAYMTRQNVVDWKECLSFVEGGRKLAYNRRERFHLAKTPEEIEAIKREYLEGSSYFVTRNPYNGGLTVEGQHLAEIGKIGDPFEIKPARVISPEGELGIAASEIRWGELPPLLRGHRDILLNIRSPFPMTPSLRGKIHSLRQEVLDRVNARNQDPNDTKRVTGKLKDLLMETSRDPEFTMRMNDPMAQYKIGKVIAELQIHLTRFEEKLSLITNKHLDPLERHLATWARFRFQALLDSMAQLDNLHDNNELRAHLKFMKNLAGEMHEKFDQSPHLPVRPSSLPPPPKKS